MAFKIPEHLRNPSYPWCAHGGVFDIPKKGDIRELKVIAADGTDLDPIYEHVSVTLNTKYITPKTPNWYEMCYVKSLFWDDEDVVIQLHVPSKQASNKYSPRMFAFVEMPFSNNYIALDDDSLRRKFNVSI